MQKSCTKYIHLVTDRKAFYKMKKHFYLLYMNGGEFINWFLNLCLIFEQATMSNNIH